MRAVHARRWFAQSKVASWQSGVDPAVLSTVEEVLEGNEQRAMSVVIDMRQAHA
jgi:hypothetical protein